MFKFYALFKELNDQTKQLNNIKVGKRQRLDCIKTAGEYEPFNELKTRGVISLAVCDSNYMQLKEGKTDSRDLHLKAKNQMNFTGLTFLKGVNQYNYMYAYGNPYKGATFGAKQHKNPFFKYRNDVFLFYIEKDFKVLELFVVDNALKTQIQVANNFKAGLYNANIEKARTHAKTFYEYKRVK